jgi:hypothetical protein
VGFLNKGLHLLVAELKRSLQGWGLAEDNSLFNNSLSLCIYKLNPTIQAVG